MPSTTDPYRQLAARLAEAGVRLGPDLVLEPRDGRAVARVGERLLWVATDASGRDRLARERRVLAVLGERCTFGVPRVTWVDPGGEADLRVPVPSDVEPFALYRELAADRALAATLGEQVGALLAELHAVPEADLRWLPRAVEWPLGADRVEAVLPDVVSDPALVRDALDLMARYRSLPVADADRALVHGDLGLHNLAIRRADARVLGAFDWEGAAWADRHQDFRYLLLHHDGEPLFEAAVGVYERRLGRPVDGARVRLYNAACAVGFLAWRRGTPAEERSCGRTLAEDLAWTRAALERVADDRSPGGGSA